MGIEVRSRDCRKHGAAYPSAVMRRLRWMALGCSCLLLRAQTGLLPVGGISAFGLQRPDATYASRTVVAVSGQPFTQAVRVVTQRTPANRWEIQLNQPIPGAVALNDVIAGEVWLRRSGGTNPAASVEGVFERSGPPYSQSLTRLWLVSGTNWTRFRFAFRSVESYSGAVTNRAQFNLRVGFSPQQVDIAGLVLTNMGRTRPVTDYPNDFRYLGREPDAPWRAAAAERIERIRKADYTVEVRDQDGFPVPGAHVSARMRRHAFGWGSAVDGGRLTGTFGTLADRGRYQAVVTNWFNKVVLENDLKWPSWEGSTPPGRTAVAALNWLDLRGISTRGHNLIWPGTSYLPSRVVSALAAGNSTLVRRQIDEHFTNVLTTVRGRLVDWDVMNEVVHERAVQDLLGDAEMVRWFRMARSLDPAARLFINEYENLEIAGTGSPAPQRLFDTVRFLQTNGAPVDGLGLQAHVGGYLPDPSRVVEQLDFFAGLGLPIQVTEFDVNISDEATQAEYLRDFVTAAFSHPAVTDFLMWGFWAGQHWLPDAALIRSDWSLRPAGIQWSNLVFREWTTDARVLSGTNGRAAFRGFKGDYEIQVVAAGVTNRFLTSGTNTVLLAPRIALPAPVLVGEVGTGGIHLSWPLASSGYRLEVCDSLNPAVWRSAGREAVSIGERWSMTVSPAASERYFRLVR